MRRVTALSLALALAVGSAGAAQAWVLPDGSDVRAPSIELEAHHDRWHEPPGCVGLATGTAHPTCGSLSGGPSGGLF